MKNMCSFYLKNIYTIILGTTFFLINCSGQPVNQEGKNPYHPDQDFNNYWYNGLAEITSYELTQSRYGEIRNGHAILIFVTEDFDHERLVKEDQKDKRSIPVIKCNFIKKFSTGIYPYSMMLSSFTPVNGITSPNTVKISTSVQEWCGHVYAQTKLKEDKYKHQLHSYFYKEHDTTYLLPLTWQEDEIWSRIRLQPEDLPIGEQNMVPSGFYTRLKHVPHHPENVITELSTQKDESIYKIHYTESGRHLDITFETNFPHRILQWHEYIVRKKHDTLLLSKAKKVRSVMTDYWHKNSLADTTLRKKLELPAY